MFWNKLAGAFGLLLFIAVASDAFEVMLLPRRVRRRVRPVHLFFKGTWSIWRRFARQIRPARMRDAFVSWYGPLSMVFLLSFWAIGLVISFGLLHWAIGGDHRPRMLFTDMYLSGSTFFTLGYGDVVPGTPANKALAVAESGTGLAFIAVTIGYLPVLYQLFSRRESRVIRLDTRAGSPPSASTLLCRHSDFEAIPELISLLKDWEQWCAELIESHLSYPMLTYYRSQHDNQSWLAALTTMLDVCATILTGIRGVSTFQARITFAVARLAVVELCRVFHLRVPRNVEERLEHDSFSTYRQKLLKSALMFSDPEEAEQRLASFRSTYEPSTATLSLHFSLPLPPWVSDIGTLDNWQRSRGGITARDLMENTRANPE